MFMCSLSVHVVYYIIRNRCIMCCFSVCEDSRVFGVSMGLLCLFLPQLAEVRTAWLTLHHLYMKGHFKSGNCQRHGWVTSAEWGSFHRCCVRPRLCIGSKHTMELNHSSCSAAMIPPVSRMCSVTGKLFAYSTWVI